MRQTILMGASFPALQARALCEAFDRDLAATATGNSQATAYAIKGTVTQFTTTAANTGCVVPIGADVGDEFEIINFGASTLAVYPPLGGTLNNGAANAAVNVLANTWARVKQIAVGVWVLK